jgi:hypothetical protein
MVEPLGQLMVTRDVKRTTGETDTLIQQIEARQILGEQGKMPAVTIYPEGCTTNGTCIIKFRKGAFGSLRKVKPYFSKIWTLTGIRPVHGDSISTWAYFGILFGQGFNMYTLYEMPVFEPNEYFWEHHWDGKEQKWIAYARAMQIIIAE